MELYIQSILPHPAIAHLVHSFWLVENLAGKELASTVLPNGMIDLTVTQPEEGDPEIILRGLETMPKQVVMPAGARLFAIGFKLPAVEYLLGHSIKTVLNSAESISNSSWKFETHDLESLENFSRKATQRIQAQATRPIDNRKRRLFELIYASHGALTVKELSEQVFWSSRQINRYFNAQFGIALKTYCSLLRFGSSFKSISEGHLFPEQPFSDQNHFIKEVRKYAGATPKELRRNQNGRFMNMTTIGRLPHRNG